MFPLVLVTGMCIAPSVFSVFAIDDFALETDERLAFFLGWNLFWLSLASLSLRFLIPVWITGTFKVRIATEMNELHVKSIFRRSWAVHSLTDVRAIHVGRFKGKVTAIRLETPDEEVLISEDYRGFAAGAQWLMTNAPDSTRRR